MLLGVSVFVLAAVAFSFMYNMRKLIRMLLVGAGLAAAVTLGVALVRLRSGRPKTSSSGGTGGPVPNNQARRVRSSASPRLPVVNPQVRLNSAAPPRTAGPVRDAPIRNFTEEQSERYISNLGGFRDRENLTMANPRQQVRLNLGEAFRRYLLDPRFRTEVDGLVSDSRTQIYSDVRALDLSGAQVEDITPLAALTDLRVLDLSRTQVQDISPLSGLTYLQGLSLWRTQVRDISQLAGLTNLRVLDLTRTQVQEISPLAGLTNLEALTLSRTQVRDISPLAALTNLRMLDLNVTQVRDITPLARLPNLQNLDVRYAPHLDLTALNTFVTRSRLQVDRDPTPVHPSHAKTVPELPAEESKRKCMVCWEPIEDLNQFLAMCNTGTQACCRSCAEEVIWVDASNAADQQIPMNPTCPNCRAPLGPLPPVVSH